MGSDEQGSVTLCCDPVCALALYVALYTKLILIAISAAKDGTNICRDTAISLFPLGRLSALPTSCRQHKKTRRQGRRGYRNTKGLNSLTKNNTQIDPTMTELVKSQQLDTLPSFSPRLTQKNNKGRGQSRTRSARKG
jgi:hypothetical protein